MILQRLHDIPNLNSFPCRPPEDILILSPIVRFLGFELTLEYQNPLDVLVACVIGQFLSVV